MADAIPIFDATRFDPGELAISRGPATVSVCIPARNEAGTIGDIVATIDRQLIAGAGLVDELVVIDDGSRDGTGEVARRAGARVVAAPSVPLPPAADGGVAEPHGKGQALWRSLAVTTGDLVVWCDADLEAFEASFVAGVLGPMVLDDRIAFVKGFYERPERDGTGGGRVTELVARPLLSLYFPHLAEVVQPLSGEYGGRRDLLGRLAFTSGYGVDLGLLIDAAAVVGTGAIAQSDLGVRYHRHRPLAQLGPQAMAVTQAALTRAGLEVTRDARLIRPGPDHPRVTSHELAALDDLAEHGLAPDDQQSA